MPIGTADFRILVLRSRRTMIWIANLRPFQTTCVLTNSVEAKILRMILHQSGLSLSLPAQEVGIKYRAAGRVKMDVITRNTMEFLIRVENPKIRDASVSRVPKLNRL